MQRGVVYPVGEEGPELFKPDSSGTIIPNNALRESSDGGLNVNVYQSNHIDSRTDQAQIEQMLERSKRETVAAVAAEIRRGGSYAKLIRGG